MAATTLSVVTSTKTGATVTSISLASSDTVTISPTTAQSIIDFNSLAIRIANTASASAVTVSLAAGTDFSQVGLGALTTFTVASGATVIFGGRDVEGARFLNSAGAIIFTLASGVGATFEAYQHPNAHE